MGFYEQPPIELFGITVLEPVTTFTDLIVAAICFYAFYRLSKLPITTKIHQYLRFYFLSMGIATTIGGLVGHGFLYLFSYNVDLPVSPWKLPGWLTSMFSIALVERAAIAYAQPLISKRLGTFFAWLNIVELTTFVIITFVTLNFFFVEVHSAYGLLVVVTSFSAFVYAKTKSEGSKQFLIAVAFSAVGALFFMNEWGLSPWFNHFDISHVFLAFSAYYFYRGAMKIVKDPDLTKYHN